MEDMMIDEQVSIQAAGDGLLTYAAAARFLAISERKLAELVRDRAIDVIRIGGSVRFSRRALEQFVGAREGK